MGVTPEELRRFELFAELNDRELAVLAEAARREDLGSGAYLTQEKKPADRLYLIASGKVQVLTTNAEEHHVLVDELGPGELVGWSAVTGPYVYTATTVTSEKSTLYVFKAARLREIFEINNHIGYRFLKSMGKTIARRIVALQAKCVAAKSGDK